MVADTSLCRLPPAPKDSRSQSTALLWLQVVDVFKFTKGVRCKKRHMLPWRFLRKSAKVKYANYVIFWIFVWLFVKISNTGKLFRRLRSPTEESKWIFYNWKLISVLCCAMILSNYVSTQARSGPKIVTALSEIPVPEGHFWVWRLFYR